MNNSLCFKVFSISCKVRTEGGTVNFTASPICYDYRLDGKSGNVNVIKSDNGEVIFNNFPNYEDTNGQHEVGAVVWFHGTTSTGEDIYTEYTTDQ